MFSFQSRASAGGAGHERPTTKGHHQEMTQTAAHLVGGGDTDPAQLLQQLDTMYAFLVRHVQHWERKGNELPCTSSQLRGGEPARKSSPSQNDLFPTRINRFKKPRWRHFSNRKIECRKNRRFFFFQIFKFNCYAGPVACRATRKQIENLQNMFPSCISSRMTFRIIKRAAYDTRVYSEKVHTSVT